MSDPVPLIIPMTVEALVVNNSVRLGGHPFVRTHMNYNGLQQCRTAQPGLSDNDPYFTSPDVVPPNNIPSDEYYNGIYLKWRLPQALTHGGRNGPTGKLIYPYVPNRWLVVRYEGENLAKRNATAWIIESDYLPTSAPSPKNASQLGSIYVNLQTTQSSEEPLPVGVYMGRNVDLSSGSWAEPKTSLGLTAMAPGNPAFAFYQPYCNNVFSFIDPLYNQPDQLYSYMVVGWYSDTAQDILSSQPDLSFEQLLNSLGWTIASQATPQEDANMSLLYGSVLGVNWQINSLPQSAGPSPKDPFDIAIGNTSIEALTALITARASSTQITIDAGLLEAFQLDALDALDEPDGAAILAERLHSTFFQKFSSGHEWQIVDASHVEEAISPQELEKEQLWLAQLNQDQANLDAAVVQLTALQKKLYTFWWKYVSWPFAYQGSTSIPGLSLDTLKQQLNPTAAGSCAQQTLQQLETVSTLRSKVPYGDTPEALEKAIQTYCSDPTRQLPSTRVLKRSDLSPFYQANNPVVLMAGKAVSGTVDTTVNSLQCRLVSQLVTGFRYQGQVISASTPNLTIPQPNLTGVSGVPWSAALIANLVQEFFFLDPNNATMVANAIGSKDLQAIAQAMGNPANDVGVYPQGAYLSWTENPWRPLLLHWQVHYFPIGYQTPGAPPQPPSWTFEDGDYVWNGIYDSAAFPNSYLQGMIQLTSAAVFNMGARITAFLKNNPYLNPQELAEFKQLQDFVTHDESWDLLSQALDGFNEQLQLGMPGVFLSPQGTTRDLLTSRAIYPPQPQQPSTPIPFYLPALPNVPTAPPPFPPTGFQPWRSGQFTFINLVLVDEWGQAFWPINSHNYQTVPVITPRDLTPTLTSNSVSFQITHATAKPKLKTQTGTTIATLIPNLIEAGTLQTDQLELKVQGNGFTADCQVHWKDAASGMEFTLATQFVDANNLTADVPANLVWNPSIATVTIVSQSGGTSPGVPFTISVGAYIGSLTPSSIAVNSPASTLVVNGVGFTPQSHIEWNQNGVILRPETTFINDTQLQAAIPASYLTHAGTIAISEVKGKKVLPTSSDSLIQLPPRLLQPAKLHFDLVSAVDDAVLFGPLNPEANPICGWVLPNHLDAALMLYDASGTILGEMAIGLDPTATKKQIVWTAFPPYYQTLEQLDEGIPHFGNFLKTLSLQDPDTFIAFLANIDETLWTTTPLGASFDKSLAVLMGRPLAMVRASLQFELVGNENSDPSWQYTFNPSPPAISGYEFAVELGNNARIEDGLIGYFVEDQYNSFNIVQQAAMGTSSYLKPIGIDNNYIFLRFDNKARTHVSLLVDPRAGVHVTTGILPTIANSLPQQFTNNALDAMQISFRMNGILTDQQIAPPSPDPLVNPVTLLMPIPRLNTKGTWTWIQNEGGVLKSYEVQQQDARARFTNISPAIRRGLLQLSSIK